jgi:DNA polymerase lambda
MGVWKGPSSPCHRRIDIKVYPWSQLAVAVNYFSSGQSFCRALRYWANTPLPSILAAAQRLNRQGNAFKLSDKELAVVHRAPVGKRWQLLSPRSSVRQLLSAEPPSSSGNGQGGGGGDAGEGGASSGGGGLDKATQLAAAAQGAVLVPAREGGERELVVGPAVALTCETDIFRTLGLPYVPPHLRNIVF